MKRIIAGVIAGLVSWAALVAVGGMLIRATWQEYAAVADQMDFTVSMMAARLGLSAVASLLAGGLAAAIAQRASATWMLGILLLIAFIPIHINLWDKFPAWYHLTFLFTLIPLSVLGGRFARSDRTRETAPAA